MPAHPTTYDRPVEATLMVRLANGEEWEATPDDLTKFGLVSRNHAYMAFRTALVNVLGDHGLIDDDARRDITDTEINPLRYFVEMVLCYPHLIDHSDHEGWVSVADLERRLRTAPTPPADTPTQSTVTA